MSRRDFWWVIYALVNLAGALASAISAFFMVFFGPTGISTLTLVISIIVEVGIILWTAFRWTPKSVTPFLMLYYFMVAVVAILVVTNTSTWQMPVPFQHLMIFLASLGLFGSAHCLLSEFAIDRYNRAEGRIY